MLPLNLSLQGILALMTPISFKMTNSSGGCQFDFSLVILLKEFFDGLTVRVNNHVLIRRRWLKYFPCYIPFIINRYLITLGLHCSCLCFLKQLYLSARSLATMTEEVLIKNCLREDVNPITSCTHHPSSLLLFLFAVLTSPTHSFTLHCSPSPLLLLKFKYPCCRPDMPSSSLSSINQEQVNPLLA